MSGQSFAVRWGCSLRYSCSSGEFGENVNVINSWGGPKDEANFKQSAVCVKVFGVMEVKARYVIYECTPMNNA